jgi:hypothetical protein
MRMNNVSLWFAAMVLAGCARSPGTRQIPMENDDSITFPQFFADSAVAIGAGDKPYELDGSTLRAISIAANDFLPSGDEDRPCWRRQEAYRYRVIRQGDIIFVRIMEDPDHCGQQYISVDTGAKYAISTNGRILRRVVGAEPEAPWATQVPDAGEPRSPDDQPDGGVLPLSPGTLPAHATIEDGGLSLKDGGAPVEQ